jgi:hypothetical protein
MASYLKEKLVLKEINTIAFLYRWTHIPTGKWYEGSRTAKGCHPDDGYICSSKVVKPMILESKDEWKRDVLVIGSPEYIAALEIERLKSIDAKNDSMSFNMHNGDGKFTTVGRIEPEDAKKKRIDNLIGKKKPEGFGDVVRKSRTGLKFNDEWRKNIGIASTGRVQDDEARRKNSFANSGDKNASFTGYCVSPTGIKYDSCKKAARDFDVSRQTIMRWAKNNLKGWSFISKDIKS